MGPVDETVSSGRGTYRRGPENGNHFVFLADILLLFFLLERQIQLPVTWTVARLYPDIK